MPGSGVQRIRQASAVRAALALGAAAIGASGLALSRRARRLVVLGEGGHGAVAGAPAETYRLVTAVGVSVDASTERAAVRHARAHDLDVLDLVPGDLPSGVLQALLLQIDPARYRGDRLAVGRGAGHASVVRAALLDRVATAHPPADGGWRSLDPVAYLELSRRLKRYAPTSTDLAVAPALRAVPIEAGWRLPHLRAHAGAAAPALAPLPAIGAVLALLAPLVHPVAGGAALAAYLAEPALVARRSSVRPRDVGVGGLLRRPFRAVADAAAPLTAGPARRSRRPRRAAGGRRPGSPPRVRRGGEPPGHLLRAAPRHVPVVRGGRPGPAGHGGRPVPGQGRHVPPRPVPGLRPRVPEPAAVARRARPLLPGLLRRAGARAHRDHVHPGRSVVPRAGGHAAGRRRAEAVARRRHRARLLLPRRARRCGPTPASTAST